MPKQEYQHFIMFNEVLRELNRRGTGPYARWCERERGREPSPYLNLFTSNTWLVTDYLLTSCGFDIILKKMTIKYRSHAVERMIQRSITPTEVMLVLNEPDGMIKQTQDKYIYYKNLKGREDNAVAAVTLSKTKNSFEILTVMVNFEVLK